MAACSDGAGKGRGGEQTAIFCLKFSSFQRRIFLKGRGEEKGSKGGKKNGIPQRRSHIFQRYNMFSAVPSLHWETHSRSTAEKRSAVKISQELHHCPRGTCSSGGESRASRSVDRNPHHKPYYWGEVGKGDPRPDRAHDFISQGLPPGDYFPRVAGSPRRRAAAQRGRTDGCFAEETIKAGETKQGGCDLKGWKSLRPGGKLTYSLCKGRYNSALLPGMYLPELAQSKSSSRGDLNSVCPGVVTKQSEIFNGE